MGKMLKDTVSLCQFAELMISAASTQGLVNTEGFYMKNELDVVDVKIFGYSIFKTQQPKGRKTKKGKILVEFTTYDPFATKAALVANMLSTTLFTFLSMKTHSDPQLSATAKALRLSLITGTDALTKLTIVKINAAYQKAARRRRRKKH